MPNALGMSFDQCVSRFSGVSGIDDADAFCGSLEKLIGLGKQMTIGKDAMSVICPPCAKDMTKRGLSSVAVGGDNPITYELSKRLHRMGGGFHVKLPIIKQEGAARGLVTGWAAIITAEDGTPLIDFDGDIIPIAELEKAVQNALKDDGGAGKAGDMHEVTGVADVVESMVISAAKRKALGFGEGPEGWVVTLKINDPELLAQIEAGEKTELSIRGRAKRVQVDGTEEDIAVLQDLELSIAELLSVVDAGASGDTNHRPAIVLVKRGTRRRLRLSEQVKNLLSGGKADADIDAPTAFGDFIRGKLDERDMTVDDLSATARIPMGTLQQIISGQIKDPPGNRVSAIAQAIGVSVSELTDKLPKDLQGPEAGQSKQNPKKRGKNMSKKKTLAQRIAGVFSKPDAELAKAIAIALAKDDGSEHDEDDKTLDDVMAEMDEESKSIIMAALAAAAKQEDPEDEDEDEDEDVEAMKKLPAYVRKQLADAKVAKAEAADLKKRVASMEDQAELEECIKTATKLPYITGSGAELGKLLKAAKALPESMQAQLSKVLAAANTAVEKSALFTENGSKAIVPDSAEAEFETHVNKIMADDPEIAKLANANHRRSQAMRKAAEQHQDLYKRVRAEEH